MTTSHCNFNEKIHPLNFKAFNSMRKSVDSIDELLILAKIRFHQNITKLNKNGLPVIARTRNEISKWFGFSQSKTDSVISSLVNKGLLRKMIGTFYGKKSLFLSVSDEVKNVPINLSILNILIEMTGSLKSALVFSKIAFQFERAGVEEGGVKMCFLRREELANFAGISIRTLDKILNDLKRDGLVLKKNLVSCARRQNHFHIPEHAIKLLKRKVSEIPLNTEKLGDKNTCSSSPDLDIEKSYPQQNCLVDQAKSIASIRRVSFTKGGSNNTGKSQPRMEEGSDRKKHPSAIISFNHKIFNWKGYALSALNKTIEKYSLRITNKAELVEQLLYSLTNKEQMKKAKSFEHAVSMFMCVIRDGNWRTPKGFSKHSRSGSEIESKRKEKQISWQEKKAQEISSTQLASLKDAMNQRLEHTQKKSVTQKALGVAGSLLKAQDKLKSGKTEQSDLSAILDLYVDQLKDLFSQGANKQKVMGFLREKG